MAEAFRSVSEHAAPIDGQDRSSQSIALSGPAICELVLNNIDIHFRRTTKYVLLLFTIFNGYYAYKGT